MKALARRPKVFFKLSGLVEGTGRSDGSAPRDVGFYRPVLDAMREMFGAERLIVAVANLHRLTTLASARLCGGMVAPDSHRAACAIRDLW
jgi:hypothetical protein